MSARGYNEDSEYNRGKRMNGLSLLLFIVGIASLFYFMICFAYAGLSTSFTMVWGVLGVGCLIVSAVHHRLLLAGFVWPNWIRAIIIAVFVIGAVIFIWAEAVLVYYSNQSAPDNVEYLVVLGARVNGTRITGSLQRRLDAAVDYLKEESNQSTKVIVAGGQGKGEDISEAQAMQDYLTRKGIDKSRIRMEDKSTNTYENIQFSRAIIQDDQARIAVVTNGFHIYRATSMARMQGMTNVYGLSASSDPVMAFSYYIREGLAVIAYKLKGSI